MTAGTPTVDARRAEQRAREPRAAAQARRSSSSACSRFGYALVPFYEKICEATGLRNIASADTVGQHAGRRHAHRAHRVRLERAQPAVDVPPIEPVVSVHPGEVTQVVFEVVNTTSHAVTGQAIPSYGPQYAAQYFRKLECFCFAQQTLQPGETRRMPVVFVIDPAAPRDLADDHAVVHVLRGRREPQGIARRGSKQRAAPVNSGVTA